MITLKIFNKQQLKDFVLSGNFEKFQFLPITKHRALSQIKNPKAEENDVLLTLAFENESLAGYLGAYPDEISIDDKKIKTAWLSTLYVNENFRGKKIAQLLLQRVFDEYHNKITITEFTKEAESLYNKLNQFQYVEPKRGKRFYFRSDLAYFIPEKKPKLSFMNPAFRMADSTFNGIISVPRAFGKKQKIPFEILPKIDGESEEFLQKFDANRSAEEINLIIENPWVLPRKTTEKKYLFSSYAKKFEYFWIKIYDQQKKLRCCALLLVRDGHLKIPYLFSEIGIEDFSSFLKLFIKKQKIKTLTSYHLELNAKLSSKQFPKLYQKDFERRYLFHQELVKALPENFQLNLQDGDGDSIFT